MLWISPTRQDPEHLQEMLGFIPSFLSEDDPRPASVQLNENYAHGGGWHPMKGFDLDTETMTLNYEGDPPLRLVAASALREELILVFQYAWVVIISPGGTYEVSRCD